MNYPFSKIIMYLHAPEAPSDSLLNLPTFLTSKSKSSLFSFTLSASSLGTDQNQKHARPNTLEISVFSEDSHSTAAAGSCC